MDAEQGKYRYERKFVTDELSLHEVESIVRMHSALFVAIYCPRYVNNIYMDSIDFGCYADNRDGNQHRCKFRIRWYGELLGDASVPVLEVKMKDGLLGAKERYPLESLPPNRALGPVILRRLFDKAGMPEVRRMLLATMRPLLANRYRRRYFRSADGSYRITIDDELGYRSIDPLSGAPSAQVKEHGRVVIELKYGEGLDDGAASISNLLPFRLSRSSKYVRGVELIYSGARG